VLTVAVAIAYLLQTVALMLELAHLSVFSRDGKGLQWRHTFFAADFAAEVLQGVSELLTALLLLFLACGWTTVGPVIYIARHVIQIQRHSGHPCHPSHPRHPRFLRMPHDTRFHGVSLWTLQLGSLWGSKRGVYCRVSIVRLET